MWISYKSGGSFLLQTEKYQCKVAEAVADGIVTYLEKQKENEKN